MEPATPASTTSPAAASGGPPASRRKGRQTAASTAAMKSTMAVGPMAFGYLDADPANGARSARAPGRAATGAAPLSRSDLRDKAVGLQEGGRGMDAVLACRDS